MHLPWSQGLQNDDRVIHHLDAFQGCEVVVTEKLDGENTTMYSDLIHARSIDGRYHPSRDWVKRFWAENVAYNIPQGLRICGENMYAQHSVRYDNLESYFYGFSAWVNDECLDWDTTLEMFANLNVIPAPVLYRGEFDEKVLRDLAETLDTARQEGYVVRVASGFTMAEFPTKIAKWVRAGHVQTSEHWMHQAVVSNKLKDDQHG